MTLYEKRLINENHTAFYVFDASELKQRIEWLQTHLPEETSLCFAMKANPFLVKELSVQVERFELCSPGEARICNSLGIPAKKMVISGVYKTPSVIDNMTADSAFDAIFTVESALQYQILRDSAKKYGRRLKVLLRLTNQSQFGMDTPEIERIIANRKDCPELRITGLQYFSGTQKTSVKKLRRELENLDRFMTELSRKYGYEADELEYGPGFPVAYFEDDKHDEDVYFREFCDIIATMKNKPRLTLELGRSIAASCGRYYTHIVDIKRNAGQNYLITDGGMHQIVYYGQHMAMKQPILHIVGKHDVNRDIRWNICGALCTMNDILAKQVCLPDVAVGDTVCFENAGAYCMAEGISLFLSRELPAVWLAPEDDEPFMMREPHPTDVLNTPHYERL
ncbi:MAG: alanine racemase [Clostridia bacterium]|nr:alanine racemase [Clostridia bacterium]